MQRPLESMQAYAMDECCDMGDCPICNPPIPEDELEQRLGYKLECPRCGYVTFDCPELANAEMVGLYEASHEGYCQNCCEYGQEPARLERLGPYTLTIKA